MWAVLHGTCAIMAAGGTCLHKILIYVFDLCPNCISVYKKLTTVPCWSWLGTICKVQSEVVTLFKASTSQDVVYYSNLP